jgi:Nidogen-like/PEP-CTERM motif
MPMPVKAWGSFLAAAVFVAAAGVAHADPMISSATFSLSSLSNVGSPCDDCATDAVSLGFSANFFGTTYASLYVNNNGIVTFTAPYSSAYTPEAIGTIPLPIIAPFYADVDTTGAGSVTYGTGTYDGMDAFMVNWTGVGYAIDESDKTDTFQLVIVSRSDVGAGDFDIYFDYGSMQWDTGDSSGGNGEGLCDGNTGNPAVAGYSDGTGDVVEVQGSGICSALIDGGIDALITQTDDGVAGQILYEVRNGEVAPPSDPPVPEPSSAAIFGTALVGLTVRRWRKRA